MKILRQYSLTYGWQTWLTKGAVLPTFGDANGRPVRIFGEIILLIRFGNKIFRVPFIVADKLVVEFIVGTRFMNRYVDAIECRNQKIRLNWGGTIPILSRQGARRAHEGLEDIPNDNEDTNGGPRHDKRSNDAPLKIAHTMRMA